MGTDKHMLNLPLAAQAQPSNVARTPWLRQLGQRVLTYLSFGVFAVIIGLPFYFVLVYSITPKDELFKTPPAYFPSAPTLDNYARLLNGVPLGIFFRNSTIFALGSSIVSVIVSGLAAYALARIRFRGSTIVNLALILSVALPQIALL